MSQMMAGNNKPLNLLRLFQWYVHTVIFYNLEILRINDPVIDSMEFITFLDAPSL